MTNMSYSTSSDALPNIKEMAPTNKPLVIYLSLYVQSVYNMHKYFRIIFVIPRELSE